MGYETVAIAKTANKATASSAPSYVLAQSLIPKVSKIHAIDITSLWHGPHLIRVAEE